MPGRGWGRSSSYQSGAFLRAQAAGTVPPSMLSSASPSRSANAMWPSTATQMPSANQSCTNVAPVRQSSGNGSNHFMIEPVREHHDAGAGDERGVELLAGVELAERAPRAALTAPEPAGVVAASSG